MQRRRISTPTHPRDNHYTILDETSLNTRLDRSYFNRCQIVVCTNTSLIYVSKKYLALMGEIKISKLTGNAFDRRTVLRKFQIKKIPNRNALTDVECRRIDAGEISYDIGFLTYMTLAIDVPETNSYDDRSKRRHHHLIQPKRGHCQLLLRGGSNQINN